MPESPDWITITREDALSEHVDDLLRRQMSLRGEGGVTRGHRHWYYQNWFVFMMVGLVAAVVAWAIIEPFFNDMGYVQGPIEELNLDASRVPRVERGNQYFELKAEPLGWLRVRGEKVWLFPFTKELRADGRAVAVDLKKLRTGQTVGVHAEPLDALGESLALGRFVTLDPPAEAAEPLSLARQSARSMAAAWLLFPLVAGLIGLAVGAADGVICRLPTRALLAGGIGLLVGFIGGFLSHILAELVYAPLNHLAMAQAEPGQMKLSTFAFLVQTSGRGLAWCLAGLAMGLGQGIALRSKRLFLYGLLGGVIGGLLGGLLFDPVDLLLLGTDKPSAHWSRLIGLATIGASVGAMIGIVELLARDAWLRMTEGPLTGKEFLLFKDVMNIGASPRNDLYLFNDPTVADRHATLRAVGDNYEIQSAADPHQVLLNQRPVRTARLRHGDLITIGRTSFVFQQRKG